MKLIMEKLPIVGKRPKQPPERLFFSEDEFLPAIEVDNQVDWVNENLKTPFRLRLGEKSKLGVFLVPEETKSYKKLLEKFRTYTSSIFTSSKKKPFRTKVEIKFGHNRSGLLTRVVFEDTDGHQYRDIDVKGLGLSAVVEWMDGMKTYAIVNPLEIFGKDREEGAGFEVYGLLNYFAARHDAEMGEAFHRAGIRTERTIAIIKLREIIDEKGKAIKLKEARKRKLISEKLIPALALRAYGTKARVLKEGVPADERSADLDDAKTMVAQEFGINPNDFTIIDYLKWFARTLGTNIGLMHKNGWFHRFIYNGSRNPKNVTLDCRITDRDSVGFLKDLPVNKKTEFLRDDRNDGLTIITELVSMADVILRKEQEQKGKIYASDYDFYSNFLRGLEQELGQEYASAYDKQLK